MPASRSRSGAGRAGSTRTIRGAGFNGTAAITLGGVCRRKMRARLNDGRRSGGTSHRSNGTASLATRHVGRGSAKLCCTGPMTVARFETKLSSLLMAQSGHGDRAQQVMFAFGGKADIEISGHDVCFDPKRNSPLQFISFRSRMFNDGLERTMMRGRPAREWPPIPPRRGMQSFGGGQTSSQQCQFQEPSQPQHSRTNKSYSQGPSSEPPPRETQAPRQKLTPLSLSLPLVDDGP
jgi:hypothetical protein